jgi:hypothetical protein
LTLALSSLDTPSTDGRAKTREARPSKAKPKAATPQNATSTKGSRQSNLPSTGKDFWPSLLTDTPQSAAEVFSAAVSALGIKPNPEDKKKLSQRMSNALSVMAKNGDIKAEGTHRQRLYSKKTVTH